MPKLNQKGIAQLLLVILLISGIGLGVFLINQKTQLFPMAASNPISGPIISSPSPSPSCTGSAGNLLGNPGFDCGSNPWQKTTNGGRSIVTTPTHSGTGSQRMFGSTVYTRDVFQTVPVTGGKSYIVSGWINTNTITGIGATIKIIWLASSGEVISTNSIPYLKGTNSWIQRSGTFSAPANAVSAQVNPYLAVIVPDNDGTAWFDDISFTPAN